MTTAARRLAIGTAQFGLSYGVANRTGQVTLEEGAAILAAAHEAGAGTIDTAVAYGTSEARLGELGVRGWRVVSKLPALPGDVTDVGGWVDTSVRESLARLRIDHLAGLLLHRPQDLLDAHGAALYAALREIRAAGFAEKIGVSVYHPEELEALWPRFDVDLVQAPFNVVDRRLAASGWLTRLHDAGIEVHTRSAFLQGLLLLPAEELPAHFARWAPLWREWRSWLSDTGSTAVQVCLGFALSWPEIHRVVVGVDGSKHLHEILSAIERPVAAPPASLMSEDEDLINPTRWTKC